MLKGIDVSHWNNVNEVRNNLKEKDFVIIKATEGVNISDGKMPTFVNVADSMDKLKGFYHYARPELNESAEAEAYYFLSRVAPYIGNCIMALDWEGVALNYPLDWALEWLETVRYCTGASPIIYTQASYCKNLQPILDHQFNLWVAHWNVNAPRIGVYPFFAIWQYSADGIDENLFNGNIDQFKALM